MNKYETKIEDFLMLIFTTLVVGFLIGTAFGMLLGLNWNIIWDVVK